MVNTNTINAGQLVRIVLVDDQPLWTHKLVGKTGMIVTNERVGYNRILEVLIEGSIYRMHPLDLEVISENR